MLVRFVCVGVVEVVLGAGSGGGQGWRKMMILCGIKRTKAMEDNISRTFDDEE